MFSFEFEIKHAHTLVSYGFLATWKDFPEHSIQQHVPTLYVQFELEILKIEWSEESYLYTAATP